MEALLQYIWKHKLGALQPLKTVQGHTVEVIDPGLMNRDAGPDFFNAKLKVDGVVWVGNVEVHVKASDWNQHGHQRDKAYNNVILHVVGDSDCLVSNASGHEVEQCVLACQPMLVERYLRLTAPQGYPPCYAVIPLLPPLVAQGWLSALRVERLEQKTQAILDRVRRCDHQWEDAFFVTLARNYGFGLNGDAFEQWANLLSLRAVDKHRDNLFQVEAFFFGQAGLLADMLPEAGDYYLSLRKEYAYLSTKFSLKPPMEKERWRFLRLRPSNFPHVRLAQLAYLYHTQDKLLSRAMEAQSVDEVVALLHTRTSAYWDEHYHFGKKSESVEKNMGINGLNLMVINTIIPFLYACGLHKSNPSLCEKALSFQEKIKAEHNHIIRLWNQIGITARTAADSQALIQLQKQYCDRKDCLRCRFGYEYLRGSKA